MPKISVVTPVYNAGEYLRKCIESVINQSFTNFEYILVNDGSTDDSLSIIEEYAAKDNRIKYKSISNSGAAKIPRDMAISMAQGEWVVGVDADDYIDLDTLEKLYARSLECADADIVYLRMVVFDDETNQQLFTVPAIDFDMKQILSGREAVMFTINGWKIGANGGMIKRALYYETSSLSSVGDVTYVNSDENTTRVLLLASNKVVFADTNYHYRKHPDSITTKLTAKNFHLLTTNTMLEKLISQSFGTGGKEYVEILKQSFSFILVARIDYINHKHEFSVSERKEIKALISYHYNRIDRQSLEKEYSFLKRIFVLKNETIFNIITRLYNLIHK